MTKVEVFATFKQANEKLQVHFSKNRDLVIRALNELQARIMVYTNSADFDKRHLGNKEALLTTEESLLLSKELCGREKVTALVKLYAPLTFNFYAFDYAIFNLNDITNFAPYDTINALTEEVQEQLRQDKSEHLGLIKEPFFYTVLEPFTYSEQDKLKIREGEEYKTLSLEEKLVIDQRLESYAERGLTPAEIKEFIISYTKIFN